MTAVYPAYPTQPMVYTQPVAQPGVVVYPAGYGGYSYGQPVGMGGPVYSGPVYGAQGSCCSIASSAIGKVLSLRSKRLVFIMSLFGLILQFKLLVFICIVMGIISIVCCCCIFGIAVCV